MMEFLELAKNRYSERSFASKSLEEEKLDKILEAGRIAPTACNYQPQRFYVLKSKEALATAAGLTYTYNAPVVILVCYLSAEAWHNPRDFCRSLAQSQGWILLRRHGCKYCCQFHDV